MENVQKYQGSNEVCFLSVSAFGNAYLFTGRRFDSKTGLYYYRNRYYEPISGRFLSRDPEEYIDGQNLYGYVTNNLVNHTDPLGLRTDQECCDDARAKGLDGGDYGGVICCDGRKVPCSWRLFPARTNWKAVVIILACIIEHEKDHFDDVDCPCTGTTREKYKSGKKANVEECKAYIAQAKCLNAALKKCGGDAACKNFVEQEIQFGKKRQKEYCGKALKSLVKFKPKGSLGNDRIQRP